jgi:phospholipase/lecithinase/hemolysin
MIKIRLNSKKIAATSGFLTAFLMICSPAMAAVFSKIYAFGDSLTDTGNINQIVQTATGGFASFPPPPYDNGRFSNGSVWVETLADKLGIDLVNFAYGGATTGIENTLDTTFNNLGLPTDSLLGLQGEVAAFQSQFPGGADANGLYAIWAGGNDFLSTDSTSFQPFDTPDTSLNQVESALNTLANLGAKNFLVLNLPDLGKLPSTIGLVDTQDCSLDAVCLNNLTASFNSQLLASAPSNTNIIALDVNSFVNKAIAKETQFGITFENVTNSCLNETTFTVCSNPDQYLFWDGKHPTAQGHLLIAEAAFQATAVPEPMTILGSWVALGFGTLMQRQFGKNNSKNSDQS